MISFAEIRTAVSIDDTCEALGFDVPNERKVHCPVHEDNTASLHLYDDHWHCYGCGASGDVIDLVMAFTGATMNEAIRYLSGAVPDDVVATARPVRKPPQDLWPVYAREAEGNDDDRQALQELIELKGWPGIYPDWLTYHHPVAAVKRWALWVPHYDWSQAPHVPLVGIKTRSLAPGNLGEKRAVPGSTFTTSLYRVFERSYADECILVEGESDTWVATRFYEFDLNIQVYGLPSGASTWRDEWLGDLLRHRRVHLCLDSDTVGRKANDRIHGVLARQGHDRTIWELPEKDFADSIRAGWAGPLTP